MLNTAVAKEPDLERLMSDYGDSLLRLCYMYLNDYQMAEDALQETFLRVYIKYGSFRGDSSEKTWITRIAINICKSIMRRRSFKEKPSDKVFSERPETTLLPDESVIEQEINRNLFNAVCGLEPIYKEAVLLFYYRQMQISEISALLKTPEGTVKTRLMRARGILGQLLGEEEIL